MITIADPIAMYVIVGTPLDGGWTTGVGEGKVVGIGVADVGVGVTGCDGCGVTIEADGAGPTSIAVSEDEGP